MSAVKVPCKPPLISETDARGIIDGYAVAPTKCNEKRADTVSFHEDLRIGLRK